MAESQKPPAASLTDPIIGGTRLGGGGMFMGGNGLNMMMPLSVTDIGQGNYQTKIGNPMFASANVATPKNLAVLGREMAGIQSFVTAKANMAVDGLGGYIGDKIMVTTKTAIGNAFYGKSPSHISSTNPVALYRDYRSIMSPLSEARLSGIAGGIGATTASSVANKFITSAARGGVFNMAMPVLELGAGSDKEPQWMVDARVERQANDKMISDDISQLRKEAIAAGRNPDLAHLEEIPTQPLWAVKENPVSKEEAALGSYEKVLEARAKQWAENERLAKLPTFNAVEDKNSFMSAHFLRQ